MNLKKALKHIRKWYDCKNASMCLEEYWFYTGLVEALGSPEEPDPTDDEDRYPHSCQPRKFTEREAKDLFKKWLEIRHQFECKERDFQSLVCDIDHSALLCRLFSGKKPLPEPPPIKNSYPDYGAVENKPAKDKPAPPKDLPKGWTKKDDTTYKYTCSECGAITEQSSIPTKNEGCHHFSCPLGFEETATQKKLDELEEPRVRHKPYWPTPGGAKECANCGKQNYEDEYCSQREPGFGVGDIVELRFWKTNNTRQVIDVQPYDNADTEIACIEYKDVRGQRNRTEPKNLKLIFPASKIPKELDGIHCEPKGDIVELTATGVIGMAIGVNTFKDESWISVLFWEPEKKSWDIYNAHRDEIKHTIWPLGAAQKGDPDGAK